MNTSVPDDLLSQLSELLDNRTGLYFPRERWSDLERGISSVAEEFCFKDAESCIRWLIDSPLTKKQIEALAGHITVGETYFFRDKNGFKVLEQYAIPELISSRRGKEQCIRIWSAGCSTGEEPYSIAILLNKMIPDLKDWEITILATDINPGSLEKASRGIYSEWSFRGSPAWIKRYFKQIKNDFEIHPKIKRMVTFSYHNLAEDAYPSLLNNTNAMDIIFCCNVLMYFSHERIKQVVQNLYHCLVDGGLLIVSPVEMSCVLLPGFEAVSFPGAIVYNYKKYSTGSQSDPIPIMVTFPQEGRKLDVEGMEKTELYYYKEAIALYDQGKYEDATERIIELFSHNHENLEAIILLSHIYANQGKLAQALKWCEKAIAFDILDPRCHYLHALILQERGQIVEAVKSLKQALYLDQNFVIAHFSLGNLSKQQGKSKESKKYFENTLMLLGRLKHDEILPESDGITAGRLSEIITSIKEGD